MEFRLDHRVFCRGAVRRGKSEADRKSQSYSVGQCCLGHSECTEYVLSTKQRDKNHTPALDSLMDAGTLIITNATRFGPTSKLRRSENGTLYINS